MKDFTLQVGLSLQNLDVRCLGSDTMWRKGKESGKMLMCKKNNIYLFGGILIVGVVLSQKHFTKF